MDFYRKLSSFRAPTCISAAMRASQFRLVSVLPKVLVGATAAYADLVALESVALSA